MKSITSSILFMLVLASCATIHKSTSGNLRHPSSSHLGALEYRCKFVAKAPGRQGLEYRMPRSVRVVEGTTQIIVEGGGHEIVRTSAGGLILSEEFKINLDPSTVKDAKHCHKNWVDCVQEIKVAEYYGDTFSDKKYSFYYSLRRHKKDGNHPEFYSITTYFPDTHTTGLITLEGVMRLLVRDFPSSTSKVIPQFAPPEIYMETRDRLGELRGDGINIVLKCAKH